MSVSLATSADLVYLDHRSELGFLPGAAHRDFVNRQRALLLHVNDAPAGFLLYRPALHPHPGIVSPGLAIVQICVDPGVRRVLHGSLLLAALRLQPAMARASYIRCWCAADLDANAFWSALEFQNDLDRDVRHAGRLRRAHHHWTQPVS